MSRAFDTGTAGDRATLRMLASAVTTAIGVVMVARAESRGGMVVLLVGALAFAWSIHQFGRASAQAGPR